MKKLALFLALGLVFNLVPVEKEIQAETKPAACFHNDGSGILQDLCSGECPGDVFVFKATSSASSYSWTVFQGASIISGQNSRTVTVQSPSVGGFLIRLSAGGSSYVDLAEYGNCP
ncbi:MAG TPA: hypothetical protein DCE41_15475 [Cytophagales bacterium]|nr:hypothetical protein [Cytophagales bacterium]HAA20481.1 hypothetical protein [Cytophagales bacterium]HAP64322.1 hypothetical protein [Cytophagales bacterium]